MSADKYPSIFSRQLATIVYISLSTRYLEYSHHVVRLHRRRRRAYAPTSNTASHDNHEKINSWVSFCFPYMGCLWGSAWRSSAKNKLTHSLRVVKRLYYKKQIEKLKSNVKAKWKVLNKILNRNKGKCALPPAFRADSHEIADPKEIANLFCKYFTNIGPNLASKIPASEKSHSSFLPPKLVN